MSPLALSVIMLQYMQMCSACIRVHERRCMVLNRHLLYMASDTFCGITTRAQGHVEKGICKAAGAVRWKENLDK